MTKKVFLKSVTVILIVLLAAGSLFLFGSCADKNISREPKRAIIVLPGLLGSALIEEGAETPFWDPLTTADITLIDFFNDPVATAANVFAEQPDIMTILTDIIDCKAGTMFPNLLLDEDGENTVNPKVRAVTWDYPGNQRYGAVQAYKELYTVMEARYGKYYDVRVFQYDWRQDNRYSAAALEKMINDNGYDEVILCAHSMGNLVVSNYLAKSEANRSKVKAFCSYAGPYFGALSALTMLEDPESIIRQIDGVDFDALPLNLGEVLKPMVGKIKKMYYDYCIDLIQNMTSIAQLLPTIELVNTLQYEYGDSFVCEDGLPITTNEQLIAFYKSRPWAKKSDGSLRKYIEGLEEYFNGMYVEANGKKVHSTTLVDTFYFAGNEIKTVDTVYIENGEMTDFVHNNLGDGTVPLYSSIMGKSVADKNVFVISGYNHFDCGNSIKDEMLAKSYEFIDAHLPTEILKKITKA